LRKLRTFPLQISYKPLGLPPNKDLHSLPPRRLRPRPPACGSQSFPPSFSRVSPGFSQTKPQTSSASLRTTSIRPSTQPTSSSSSSLLLGNLAPEVLPRRTPAHRSFSRCGHCKALAPHYEEAATALKERKIPIAKVDCVDHPDLCQKHGVSGYP